ncbi:sulfate ABC transporter permease [Vibrio kasasachensis]|uniref:sulfate ABC transporter permease n=1 Tax=Vibrio kasasachensis TaxID=2910248 RepID=UPI003D0F67DA
MNKWIPLLLGVICTTPSAFANIELDEYANISGFGSTSWAKSDNSTPLLIHREIDDSSCFDCDTTFGLQLDLYYENLRASAQLVKRPQDHWSEPELEWGYLAYAIDNWSFNVGRLRAPLFLYSEYYYVGQAYTPARPPGEVYNSILGITYYEGGSVTWTKDLGEEYTLSITPFAGIEDTKEIKLNSSTLLELNTHEMMGLNVVFSSNDYRWNFSYLNSKYDQKVTIHNFVMGPVTLPSFVEEEKDNKIELFAVGAEYEFENLTLTSEAQKNDRTTSWYALAANRFGKWTPYISYAQQYNESDKLEADSLFLGTRYDLFYSVSINAEWQYFDSKQNLEGSFVETPNSSHANLFSITVNFVF